MSRPTRPQTRRPTGRTRPPGPIESAALQSRARGGTRISSVKHEVAPPSEPPATPPRPVTPPAAAPGRARPVPRPVTSLADASGRAWRSARSNGVGRVYDMSRRGGRGLTRHGRRFGGVWRRWGLRAWIILTVVLLTLLGTGWVLFFSPWLTVTQVRLLGGQRFTQATLDPIAAGELGRPLALVDTGRMQAAIERESTVAEATVVRGWPHTVEVRVTERTPVAALPVGQDDTDGFDLIAEDGVVIAREDEAPQNLPVITPATRQAGEPTVTAVATVIAALADERRAEVVEATAASPDSIDLILAVTVEPGSGRGDDPAEEPTGPVTRKVEVSWGSAEDSALKAEVVSALLSTDADVFDVSAPLTPVTR